MYWAASRPSSGEKRLWISASASFSVSRATVMSSYSPWICSYSSCMHLRLLASTRGSPMADRRPLSLAIWAESCSVRARAAVRARLSWAASLLPLMKSSWLIAVSSRAFCWARACS